MRLSQLSNILIKKLDKQCTLKTTYSARTLSSVDSTTTVTKSKESVTNQTETQTNRKQAIQTNVGAFSNKPTTVDASDVDHHTAQLKIWWDPNGQMKALHAMNLVRIPFVRDGLVIETEQTHLPLKGKKILDIGCGGGILSEGLARIGAEVTGIDASKELIELAKKHSNMDPKIAHNKPKYIFTSIEEHANTHQDYYDGVVASEIIEHVTNKELFVQASVNTIKPGGRIFFTTPNRTRAAQILGIYVAEYILGILPKGTHQYEKFTTPPELTFLLERNKCHVESIQGLFYHFITNSWEWVNSQDFVFALQAQKLDFTNDKK